MFIKARRFGQRISPKPFHKIKRKTIEKTVEKLGDFWSKKKGSILREKGFLDQARRNLFYE